MNAPLARWEIAAAATPNASYRVATETAPAPARPAAAAAPMSRRLADALAWVAAFPRRRSAMAELSGLTDRELADIGLTRSELRQVFRRGFADGRGFRRTF